MLSDARLSFLYMPSMTVIAVVLLLARSPEVDPPAAAQALPVGPLPNQQMAPSPSAESAIPRIGFKRWWKSVNLRRPVQLVARADRSDRAYIVEQAGRVIELDAVNPESEASTVWLDITDRVNDANNEEGLLSIAFHPKVAENKQLYLYYTAESPRREVLSRMRLDESGQPDPSSEEILLEVKDPAWNHNGGTVLFGPDGFLYLSLGDGGSGNDPWGNGQNMGTMLAKVVRIDVEGVSTGKPYAVPADNPFVATAGALPEIWALGLRNIWRMSFDRSTGELYGGDVGQNAFEEIDIISKGGNYGWRPREGFHRTPGVPDGSEADSKFTEPLVEYPRADGVSVTGGYVIRDPEMPQSAGVYIYADYAYGTVWGLRTREGKLSAGPTVVGKRKGLLPASFGEFNDGKVFILGTERGADGPGAVYQVISVP
ncbi:MAG: glucose sorbosone dehydrogenase [Phycisphaerales bacterium]|nr:glucose sorbosone dehydrogenase [Phycisphaerales bacterium]